MPENRPLTIEYFTTVHREAFEWARKLADACSEETFFSRLNESTWSPAECIGHIVRYNELYLRNMEPAISGASPGSAAPHQILKLRLPFRWIIRFFDPPYTIRVKTLKPFAPETAEGASREQVLMEFRETLDRLNIILEKARTGGYDLNRIKAPNPILTFIKMRLSECFGVVDAHQRRHLWQAEQYIEKLRGRV